MKKIIIFLMTLFIFSNLFNYQISEVAAKEKKNGKATLMITSLEGSNFNEKEKKELKEAGWEFQGNTLFLERVLANQTIYVNGKKVKTDKNGEFTVDKKKKSIKVKLKNGITLKVNKNNKGVFKFTETIDWINFNNEMDFSDSQNEVKTSAIDNSFSIMAYGKEYKKGDWVHCNRFNGPLSDGYHYPKTYLRAYKNFVNSDCDKAVSKKCVNDYTSNAYCNGSGGAAACSGLIKHSKKYHKH